MDGRVFFVVGLHLSDKLTQAKQNQAVLLVYSLLSEESNSLLLRN